ncbi:MAG TPA: aminotransferase class I/II-fold pyridoxal phosphate-dependent enzyme [Thermoanaerobaculia bacterium]|nr:aminotransferase class I/II-fold pyridoxal phosphate-dependent enzyme [Thermoanaerobaculia bacterium]
MTTKTIPVRPEIRALRAYRLTEEDALGVRAKLDFNESPDDVPDDIRAEVLGRLKARRWGRYPEFGAPRLKKAIATALGRGADEIVVGNGSGETILAAVSVFAGGATLVLAPPTFSLYGQIAAIASARIAPVRRRGPDFDLDEAAFLAEAAKGVPLVCSPNNPTGGVSGRAFVEKLLDAAPVVLLDQAYVEFAAREDDLTGLVASRPNLVVFRTLSKAYAAAGFRVGYAVAPPSLAREIDKAVLPFNVDVAAEELALALLARPDVARERVRRVVEERERVARVLRSAGHAVASSSANFLFVGPRGGDAGRVRRGLLERGVLVRDMSDAAAGRLRVTIGTPGENDLFLEALREVS